MTLKYHLSPMCGRYQLSKSEKQVREHFGVSVDEDYSPRYNISPSQSVITIRQDATAPDRLLSKMRWGLVPFWAKDVAIGYKMINARSETVMEKPAYRDSFKKRRCLIPAAGFYEWKKIGKEKQPYNFGMTDDSIFAFAGIWDTWKSPDGTPIDSCSILTTTPNTLVQDVHDRMPVILATDDYDQWLDPGVKETSTLVELLKPFPAKQMRRFPVSQLVNSPKNDKPECLVEAPIALRATASV
jgi:putative SOS response-associated peptidase YedK